MELLGSLPEGKQVSFDWSTADISATAGADYNANSGSVVFDRNNTSVILQVEVLDDFEQEGDETFTVNIENVEHNIDNLQVLGDGFSTGM